MDRIVPIADGFWNIRGRFRILGLLDVGTQSSLARLQSGGFALIDCYTLAGHVQRELLALTDDGARIEAIFNLHPFHTVHVERVAAAFPNARLYGTRRHHNRFPSLRWEPERTESEAFRARFAEDFDFMVPAGVDFIPSNENLHFSSVLAFHKASRTLHVDDTLNWIPVPVLRGLSFHPTLASVLEPRAGAASAFNTWGRSLVERCQHVEHVCTAHARLAPLEGLPPVATQVEQALHKVQGVLQKHEAKHG